MSVIEWSLKLDDLVSGPGTRIERQLRQVSGALKMLDLQAKQTRLGSIVDPIKRSRLELQIQRDKLLLSKKAMESSGSALGGFAEKLRHGREAMRDWLQILDPLARGFSFVASSASRMGRDIASAIGTRERAMLGLTNALGNAGGSGMMQQIQGMSVRTGRPLSELSERATKWANLGMDPKLIMPSLTARSDAQALGLDSGKFDNFIEQTLSKPMMDMREAKAGTVGLVKGKSFYENLGKIVGRRPGDLEQDVGENKVPGQAGLLAMLQTLQQQQGGALGGGTDKFSHSLEGILDRFETRLTKLWGGIADTPGFKTFKSSMENLLSVLSQSKTQKIVNDIANSLGSMLKPLTGPEGKKNIADFFKTFTDGATEAMEGIGYLGTGLMSLLRFTKNAGAVTGQAAGAFGVLFDKGANRDQKQSAAKLLGEGVLGWDAPPESPMGALTPEAQQRVARQYRLEHGNPTRDDLQVAAKKQAAHTTLHVNVHVDARGAKSEDAHDIAKQISDQVPTHIADALEQMNTEAP